MKILSYCNMDGTIWLAYNLTKEECAAMVQDGAFLMTTDEENPQRVRTITMCCVPDQAFMHWFALATCNEKSS